MAIKSERIQNTLLNRWMSNEDNPYTVWYGFNSPKALQLLNKDNSNPYTRQVQVSPEIMAYDSNISITTQLFRVTLVTDRDIDLNTNWWLSSDRGITKIKVDLIKKVSRAKQAYWHLYLKLG